ncbi:YdcF family protein [Rhizobium sp. GN54]|uniref:YdcF family protein n=1 Tax=Rhizobium sp. GN54 TaxID=2898150 RepID=UPI001E605284|nr:YdcF family protein [Rhizobium sp. GN54]MCD2184005.1 YdcF family protein [Rhizobium sp. GN54]
MSYYASKFFWLAAQPLSLAFFAIVVAILFGWFGRRRLQAAFMLLSAAILFVTLYTSAGTVMLQALEDRFARSTLPVGGPRCIIVLGGSFEAEVIAARGGVEMNQAGDRFVETLRLLQAYPEARVLVSGGDGSFSGRYAGDATVSAAFFAAYGISPVRLIQEETSRTTFENVENTRDLLVQNGLDDCLLVTSAFHMPRAMGLFRKAGLDVVPWPTDYRTSGMASLQLDFTQPSSNAQLTTTALREWIGLTAYYLAGRTETILPE